VRDIEHGFGYRDAILRPPSPALWG
jgi:hypothetical protein